MIRIKKILASLAVLMIRHSLFETNLLNMSTAQTDRLLAGDFSQNFKPKLEQHQPHYFFFWIEWGCLSLKMNNHIVRYSSGNLFMLAEVEIEIIGADELSGYWILVNEPLFQKFRRGFLLTAIAWPFHQRNFVEISLGFMDIRHLNAFVLAIIKELKGFISLALAYSYTFSMLIYITRLYHCFESGMHTREQNFSAFRRLICLIEINYKTQRQLAFYETEMALTRKSLNNLTLHAVGKLLSALIQERLLAEAEHLLAQAFPIKEIAYTLGFCAQSHFSSFYKKFKGVSPKWHKVIRAEEQLLTGLIG